MFQIVLLLSSQLLFAPLISTSAFVLGTRKLSRKALLTTRNNSNSNNEAKEEETITETVTTNTKKKNPIDIFGIDHVVLLVDDLRGMTEWYETVLGCKVAKHNEKFQMIHLDAGSALIDLVDKAGPLGNNVNDNGVGNDASSQQTHKHKHNRKLDHICLALTDFDEDAIKDHLSSHGVTITTDTGIRYGKGGDGESLYFEDPEGTRIEIKKTRLTACWKQNEQTSKIAAQ